MRIWRYGRSSFFDSDGLVLWTLCLEFGHDYWRIPESPNGICLVCGEVAQDVLKKVHHIHCNKDTLARLRAFGNCHTCGVELTIKHLRRHKTTQNGLIFCGANCRAKYVWSIEPDPNGTTEPPPIPWHFNNIAPFILRRDKQRCRKCGIKKADIEYGNWESVTGSIHKVYRTNLEIHHIIPRVEGGSDHPANLITLCHNCHTTITTNDVRRRIHEEKFKNMTKLETFL